MSWWKGLHIALSISLFIGLFVTGDDQPLVERFVKAALFGLLWLPLLILLVIVMLIDAGAGLWRSLRK